MGERLPCKQEVTSSTLVFSTSAISTAEAGKQKSTYACIKVAFCLSDSIGRMPVSEKALLSSSTQCGSREAPQSHCIKNRFDICTNLTMILLSSVGRAHDTVTYRKGLRQDEQKIGLIFVQTSQ